MERLKTWQFVISGNFDFAYSQMGIIQGYQKICSYL